MNNPARFWIARETEDGTRYYTRNTGGVKVTVHPDVNAPGQWVAATHFPTKDGYITTLCHSNSLEKLLSHFIM